MDTSTHDQTSDMSADTAMSIRETAEMAGVTDKTVRRWIKSGRLHAVKLGGQYRITVADLEHARDTDTQTLDTGGVATGQDSPRVDMSNRLDSGHERDVQPPIDLAPLVDHIASLERQVGQLTETSTMWQVRALQAEERLQQLTATITTSDESGTDTTTDTTESDDTTDQISDVQSDPTMQSEGVWARLRRWWKG
jgi:excisionase family DNA binding protein